MAKQQITLPTISALKDVTPKVEVKASLPTVEAKVEETPKGKLYSLRILSKWVKGETYIVGKGDTNTPTDGWWFPKVRYPSMLKDGVSYIFLTEKEVIQRAKKHPSFMSYVEEENTAV